MIAFHLIVVCFLQNQRGKRTSAHVPTETNASPTTSHVAAPTETVASPTTSHVAAPTETVASPTTGHVAAPTETVASPTTSHVAAPTETVASPTAGQAAPVSPILPAKKRTYKSACLSGVGRVSRRSTRSKYKKKRKQLKPIADAGSDDEENEENDIIHDSPFYVRNSPLIDDLIFSLLVSTDSFLHVHFQQSHTYVSGDSRADQLNMLKHVSFTLESFFPLELDVNGTTITSEHFMSFCHFVLLDAADHMELNCLFENLLNNNGRNDNRRKAASETMSQFPRLVHLLRNVVNVLKEDGLFGPEKQVFATSGNGEEDSITLLLALTGCGRQMEHFDYDHNLYIPRASFEDVPEHMRGSYLRFNGASLFINFSLDDQSLDLDYHENDTGDFAKLIIPAMGLLVIRGDLKHAGAENNSGNLIRKFFLYLDPCRGCRMQGECDDGEKANVIYFDEFYREYEVSVSGDEVARDEVECDEVARDEVECDEVARDEVECDEVARDEF